MRRAIARLWCAGLLAGLLGAPALAPLAAGAAVAAPAGGPLATTLSGKVVQYAMSGFEPDFDPINRVVIATTLRDRGAHPLPAMQLVLSAYLENFQPDTTPVLPDLLHPNQTATSLGGFMQGKAALVNAGGHVAYSGSMLAEAFFDNSVHLLVTMHRNGVAALAAPLRLKGIFTLHKDLSVTGSLGSAAPLRAPDVAALRVPIGHPAAWQSVIAGMAVRLPKMMGTASSSGKRPAHPKTVLGPAPASGTAHATISPAGALLTGAGVLLIVVALVTLAWPRITAGRRRPASPAPEQSENGPRANEAAG